MDKVNKPLSCPYCHEYDSETSYFPIDDKEVDTLINNHKKTKEKVNNSWMGRYR